MIRLLILGRSAAALAQRLGAVMGEHVEFDVARLPAEGIRRFEHMPPDVLIVVDDTGAARVPTLITALKARPLGQLVPMVLVCPMPPAPQAQELSDQLQLEAWLAPETSGVEFRRVLAQALDMQVDQLQPRVDVAQAPAPAAKEDPALDMPTFFPDALGDSSDDAPVRTISHGVQGGYIVEELDDGLGPAGAVRFDSVARPVEVVDRVDLFPARAPAAPEEQVGAESIRHKLKQVRHEDYYVMLEVRRGAEGPTIKQAYQRQMARFDPQGLSFEVSRQFFHELAEIRDAFEDAWAVLGDPRLRQAYSMTGGRAMLPIDR